GEAYLVPWDGHPDFPSALYPLKDLYETLNGLRAENIVVILDSCFSGAPGRSVTPKGARPAVVKVEDPLLAGGKVMVLAAATGTQISSEDIDDEHGLFTYYFIDAIIGDADGDQDGLVSVSEAFHYVRDHVSKTALEELNRDQTPVLLPEELALG